LINPGRAILNYCHALRQQMLPALCLLCAAPATRGNLCLPCRDELPYLPPSRCPRCAAPSFDEQTCGACLANPPQFDQVIAACSYAFPLDRLIQRLKFSGYLAAVPLLADLLLEEIERAQCRPDAILALPLSRERLRERGFNPSLEIARVLARETGIALVTEACVRVRHGQAQSALASSERQRNVRGAFACTASLHGLSIAVVDDVLTTGSTLNEVASVLRKSGAERVVGWIATRTPAPNT
jgi:ComF family protein